MCIRDRSRMRGTPGKVESAGVRTLVGQTPGTHKASRHHWIHTVLVEIVLFAPFRWYACGENSNVLETLLPPTLSQQTIKVVALLRYRHTLGHLMSCLLYTS